MNYSPFTDSEGNLKSIFDIQFSDLEQLKNKEIKEGPFVEYKRELSPSVKKKIPNIITSFANERGGWFFIGIDEINTGISCIDKSDYELMVSNMLKDNTSPTPRTIIRFLSSDEDSNKGVLVIWVLEGDNPPYISNGKIYRRVGSGSSPLQEVDDRYYLDKLYEKASDNRKNLIEFCKKEISINNHVWNMFTKKYIEYGMCNIYLIPAYPMNIAKNFFEPTEFVNLALEISNREHIYPLDDGGNVTFKIPMEKVSFSHKSIVFRHSALIDHYERTVAWEQFWDGKAKFHIPLSYLDKEQCIESIEQDLRSLNNNKVLSDFDYVDSTSLIGALLGCLSNYVRTMKSIDESFKEIIVAIEFDSVRKDVLYFDNPYFRERIRENGLVFSDRGYYFFNKEFQSAEILNDNIYSLFILITGMFNAFGWSMHDGMQLFVQSVFKKLD